MSIFNPFKKKFLISVFKSVVICLMLTGHSMGQTVTVSEEMQMDRDADYDILGKYGTNILMASIGSNDVLIRAFDENLYNAWNRTLNLEAKKTHISGIVPLEDGFLLVYAVVKKDSLHLKMRKFDETANVVDSLAIKSYGKSSTFPRFKIDYSDNKQWVVIHHMAEDDHLEALYINLPDWFLVADHLYDVSEFDFKKTFRKLFVSNAGDMYVVLDNIGIISKIGEQQMMFIKSGINSTIPSVIELMVLEMSLTGLIFQFDNVNNQILGGGLFSERMGNETLGSVRISVSGNFSSRPSVAYISYDPQLIQDFRAGRKGRGESLANLIIQDMLIRHDGGIILIAEERKEYERSLYQGRRDFYSMRFAVDYYYEDLVLLAIHPDGSRHWQKLLQKKQYSFDDDALYSSFFVFKNQSSVRLLYNDEIKNENTVSEYILTGSGQHERRSVLSTNRQDLRLQIRNALQLSPHELIIPSIKRNKLKLVKVTYNRT